MENYRSHEPLWPLQVWYLTEIYCLQEVFEKNMLKKGLMIDLASRFGNNHTNRVLQTALDPNYILPEHEPNQY